MKPKNRRNRLPEIIDLLQNTVITSQEDLAQQLEYRGFATTQATLSRDLKLLKASKMPDGRGSYRYIMDPRTLAQLGMTALPTRPGVATSEEAAVLSVARTGHLLVIKTRNGYAQGLAYDIDMLSSELILGTVSGADTIFMALREDAPKADLVLFLSKLIPPHLLNHI